MKLLSLVIVTTLSHASWAQTDTHAISMKFDYTNTNPGLHYAYDSASQVHDYSGNWDFDADGKNDRLLFVGTGGAHLYYYLKLVLSSDQVVHEYHELLTDFPALPPDTLVKVRGFNPASIIGFVVCDLDSNGTQDLFLHLDEPTSISSKRQLQKKGIRSGSVMITISNKKIRFKDYKP